jgi:hypothetical protein
MDDLTAYDSALVERVAREMTVLHHAENLNKWVYAGDVRAVLRALGLIGPNRTAWLAPWEETDAMYEAGHAAFQDPKNHHGDVFGEVYYAMRDAHLKEGGA